MLFRRVTSICVFSLIFSLSLFAQGDRGTITGTVTDSTGAPMPNVAVNITNTATNTSVRVTTTGTGEYNVSSLQPGPYRVEIVAPGFKRYVQAGIQAAAGSSVRLDAKLEIGQVTQTVEVQSQNAQIQTEDAKITAQSRTNWSTSCRWWWAARCAVRSTWSRPFRKPRTAPTSRSAADRAAPSRRHLRRRLRQHQPAGQHHRNLVPDAFRGSHHRIRRGHQRLQSRVRAGRRRRHQLRVEIRHQRTARLGLRFHPQRLRGRARLLRADQGRLPAERFRRLAGRAGLDSQDLQRPEPHLLLRGLRRLPQPAGQRRHDLERAHAGNVPGRLLQLGEQQEQQILDLRHGHHARQPQRLRLHSRSLPGQHDSAEPLQHRLQPVPRDREIGAAAQPRGHRAGHDRLRQQNYVSGGGSSAESTTKFSVKIDHAISSDAPRVLPLQPRQRPAAARRLRPGGTAGSVQRLLAIQLRRRPAPRDYDWTDLAAHVQSLLARHQHLQQGLPSRSTWARTGRARSASSTRWIAT